MQRASCFSSSPLVPNLWKVHLVNLGQIRFNQKYGKKVLSINCFENLLDILKLISFYADILSF